MTRICSELRALHLSSEVGEKGQLKHTTAAAVKHHYGTRENVFRLTGVTDCYCCCAQNSTLCFDRGTPLETESLLP